MTNSFEEAVTAVRTYAIASSGVGIQRWYVYRRAAVTGGQIPPDALIFFSKDKAESACDRLNTQAVIEVWQ